MIFDRRMFLDLARCRRQCSREWKEHMHEIIQCLRVPMKAIAAHFVLIDQAKYLLNTMNPTQRRHRHVPDRMIIDRGIARWTDVIDK